MSTKLRIKNSRVSFYNNLENQSNEYYSLYERIKDKPGKYHYEKLIYDSMKSQEVIDLLEKFKNHHNIIAFSRKTTRQNNKYCINIKKSQDTYTVFSIYDKNTGIIYFNATYNNVEDKLYCTYKDTDLTKRNELYINKLIKNALSISRNRNMNKRLEVL